MELKNLGFIYLYFDSKGFPLLDDWQVEEIKERNIKLEEPKIQYYNSIGMESNFRTMIQKYIDHYKNSLTDLGCGRAEVLTWDYPETSTTVASSYVYQGENEISVQLRIYVEKLPEDINVIRFLMNNTLSLSCVTQSRLANKYKRNVMVMHGYNDYLDKAEFHLSYNGVYNIKEGTVR